MPLLVQNLGNYALVESDLNTAERCFEESETIMRSFANLYALQWYIGFYSVMLVYCGKLNGARQKIIDALTIKSDEKHVNLLVAISLLYWAEKRWERSIELYALACKNPYIGKSQWFADVVGKKIDEAAAELPPKVVVAARRRGREMDMWETAASLLAELSEQD